MIITFDRFVAVEQQWMLPMVGVVATSDWSLTARTRWENKLSCLNLEFRIHLISKDRRRLALSADREVRRRGAEVMLYRNTSLQATLVLILVHDVTRLLCCKHRLIGFVKQKVRCMLARVTSHPILKSGGFSCIPLEFLKTPGNDKIYFNPLKRRATNRQQAVRPPFST